METEQLNRQFTEKEKNAGINRRTEHPQQKYTVWVDEFLVKDAPYPNHQRRSTHECYTIAGLSFTDVAKSIDDQINKTYLDENPPEVVEIQIVGIFAVNDDSNSVVDAEVSKNTEDNSETAIVQRCYDLIENIEQQCADYRKIVKEGKQTFMEEWQKEYMKSRFCSFEDNVRIGNWMRKNL